MGHLQRKPEFCLSDKLIYWSLVSSNCPKLLITFHNNQLIRSDQCNYILSNDKQSEPIFNTQNNIHKHMASWHTFPNVLGAYEMIKSLPIKFYLSEMPC